MTTQGAIFQAQYQQMIALGQQPASVPTTSPAQPTSPANSTATVNRTPAFSFEDGGTDGWSGHGIVNVQNSITVALDGKHALQVTVSNISRRDFPYISVSTSTLSSYPQAGQTITAYIYLPAHAVSLMAKVFVMASTYHWYSDSMLPLTPGAWNHLTYTLPSAINEPLRQIGIQLNGTTDSGINSDVYIDALTW